MENAIAIAIASHNDAAVGDEHTDPPALSATLNRHVQHTPAPRPAQQLRRQPPFPVVRAPRVLPWYRSTYDASTHA